MGVRILRDPVERRACMYDSVSEQAFGPVLSDPDDLEAEAFLAFVREQTGTSPHRVSEGKLRVLYATWKGREAAVA